MKGRLFTSGYPGPQRSERFYSVPGGGGTGVADGAYGADALLPGDDSFLSAGRVLVLEEISTLNCFCET